METNGKTQGRPTIPTDAKRRNRVTFCLTDAELDALVAEAEEYRIAMSVYIRLKLISSKLPSGVSNG